MPKIASKQSGSTSIGGASTSVTVNITEVNTSKSIILLSGRGNLYELDDSLFYPQFNSSTQIQITRENNSLGNTLNLEWQVIEFADQVQVTTYTITTDGSNSTFNETISPVDRSKTFLIVYTSSTSIGNPNNENGYCQATLTTDTNIQLVYGDIPPAGGTTKIQVVTMSRCRVQEISDSLTSTSGDTALTRSVDVSKSIIFVSFRTLSFLANNGQIPNFYLSDSNTLTAVRDNTGNTINFTAYVVESPDFRVQNGSTALNGTASATDSINEVDITKSFVSIKGGYQCLATNNRTSGTSFAYFMFTIELSSSTQISLQKNFTTGAGDITTPYWQVVEVNFVGDTNNAVWM